MKLYLISLPIFSHIKPYQTISNKFFELCLTISNFREKMEALSSLGIDWKLLLAQAVNFLILLFILSKLLYKPIVNLLEERKNKIEKGLADAEKSKNNLEKAELDAEKIREKAYKESNEILENAKNEATEETKKIVSKAEKQAEDIRKHAATESLATKDKALKEAKGQISEVVLAALSKTVHGIELEQKKELSEKAMKEIDL